MAGWKTDPSKLPSVVILWRSGHSRGFPVIFSSSHVGWECANYTFFVPGFVMAALHHLLGAGGGYEMCSSTRVGKTSLSRNMRSSLTDAADAAHVALFMIVSLTQSTHSLLPS